MKNAKDIETLRCLISGLCKNLFDCYEKDITSEKNDFYAEKTIETVKMYLDEIKILKADALKKSNGALI